MYRIKQATKKGWIECCEDGLADLSYPDSKTRRGRVQGGGQISPTLTANQSEIYKMGKRYRIRKLTPLECFRLMGVTETNARKMISVNSTTQCEKQAGNSIVVPVLIALFSQMNIQDAKQWNDMTEDEIYRLITKGCITWNYGEISQDSKTIKSAHGDE